VRPISHTAVERYPRLLALPHAGLLYLEAGDVLTVTRLDRLARSTRELLNALAAITGKKAGFRSLGDT
jgi:Resolvase, N terminal domain